MMLMYPNITDEQWATGEPEDFAKMGKYNEELSKAGVLLALDGLHPQGEGVRISWDGNTPTAHDGPFTEIKEIVGGYWIIQVRTKDEAVEWAKRIPNLSAGQVVELRQIQEIDEFPADIREAVLQTKV
jgi:hypothetical protein